MMASTHYDANTVISVARQLAVEVAGAKAYPDLVAELGDARLHGYLLRFVDPFVTASLDDVRLDPCTIATLQMMFACVWRLLDSSLDQDVRPGLKVTPSVINGISERAVATAGKYNVAIDGSIEMLAEMVRYHDVEKSGRVRFKDIHRRCSPLFVVPMATMAEPASFIPLYASYLNLVGFVHDVHDVLKDTRRGEITVPVRILHRVFHSRPFTARTSASYFSICGKIILSRLARVRAASQAEGAFNVLLDELSDYGRECLGDPK